MFINAVHSNKGKENKNGIKNLQAYKSNKDFQSPNKRLPRILEKIGQNEMSRAGKMSHLIISRPIQPTITSSMASQELQESQTPQVSQKSIAMIPMKQNRMNERQSKSTLRDLIEPAAESNNQDSSNSITKDEQMESNTVPVRIYSAPYSLSRYQDSIYKRDKKSERSKFENLKLPIQIEKEYQSSSTNSKTDCTIGQNSLNWPDGLRSDALELSSWNVEAKSKQARSKSVPKKSKIQQHNRDSHSRVRESAISPSMLNNDKSINIFFPSPKNINLTQKSTIENPISQRGSLQDERSSISEKNVAHLPSRNSTPSRSNKRVSIGAAQSNDAEHPTNHDMDHIAIGEDFSTSLRSRSETRNSNFNESESDQREYYNYFESLVSNTFQKDEVNNNVDNRLCTMSSSRNFTPNVSKRQSIIDQLPYKELAMETFQRSQQRLRDNYYEVGFYVSKLDERKIDDITHRGKKVDTQPELTPSKELPISQIRKRGSISKTAQALRSHYDRPPSALLHRRLSASFIKTPRKAITNFENPTSNQKRRRHSETPYQIKIHVNTPRLPRKAEQAPGEKQKQIRIPGPIPNIPILLDPPMIAGMEKSPRYRQISENYMIHDLSSPKGNLSSKISFVTFSQEQPSMPFYNRILHRPNTITKKRGSINPFSASVQSDIVNQTSKGRSLSLRERMLILERGHR